MSVESNLEQFGVAEVIVSLKDVAPGATAGLAATEFQQQNLARYFTTSERSTRSLLAAASNKPHPGAYRVYEHLGIVLGTVNRMGWQGLKTDSRIASVDDAPKLSLIQPIRPIAAVAAPTTGPTWGIQKLAIPKLWDLGYRGRGMRIGHLDTGIDGKHPAFPQGAIAAFAEFDVLGNEVHKPKVTDSGDHGTHTAATLVGRPVKNFQFGVAPEAALYSAKVIEGGDVLARVLGGLNWCLGQQVQILSLSLGFRGYDPSFLPLIEALRARGVLPVVAVGNEGPGTSRSPGNYDNVLSVGATDNRDRVADYSSSQPFTRPLDPLVPDLVGPGSGVISALPGGGYQTLSGTSMATPHIAGLAALLWQAVPTATAIQIEQAILQSCRRPAAMPQNRSNRGMPDALSALKILNPSAVTKPKLKAAPKAKQPAAKSAPAKQVAQTKSMPRKPAQPKARQKKPKSTRR